MTAASTPTPPESQEIPTDQGPARIRVHRPAGTAPTRGTVLLGHGAGGQQDAADLVRLTELSTHGWTVVLVDQPWRVAGRRVATPPPSLDRAWLTVLKALGEASDAPATPDGIPLPRPWVIGGRSAGARVACRTSLRDGTPAPGVAGVVALAFPLHPPGRPERSRADELAGPVAQTIPTLVVQGTRDPMGRPEEIREAMSAVPSAALTLHEVPGNHAPTRDLDALFDHVLTHLESLR